MHFQQGNLGACFASIGFPSREQPAGQRGVHLQEAVSSPGLRPQHCQVHVF